MTPQNGDTSRNAMPCVMEDIPCRRSSRPSTDASAKKVPTGWMNAHTAPSRNSA